MNNFQFSIKPGCVLALLCLFALPGQGRAQQFRLESAGARFGFSAGDLGGQFYQAEAFVDGDLFRPWDLGSGWRLQPRLDTSAGWLGQGSRSAVIGAAAPSLALRLGTLPLSLDLGSGPTLLSRTRFEFKDFAIPFQFTTHAGIYWDITSRLRLGYRFQHMSNADLASPNPGLNLHVVALSYRF